MKKILSLILALAMALSLAVPAFAETTTANSNNEGKAESSTTIGGSVDLNTAAYVMTIPAGNTEMDMTSTEAQEVGDLKITRIKADKDKGRGFDIDRTVAVAIESDNDGYLEKDDSNKLGYTLSLNTTAQDWEDSAITQNFSASAIDAETAVELTATICSEDVAKVKNGTYENGEYEDVLTFVANVSPAYPVHFQWLGDGSAYTTTKSDGTTVIRGSLYQCNPNTLKWVYSDALGFMPSLDWFVEAELTDANHGKWFIWGTDSLFHLADEQTHSHLDGATAFGS